MSMTYRGNILADSRMSLYIKVLHTPPYQEDTAKKL